MGTLLTVATSVLRQLINVQLSAPHSCVLLSSVLTLKHFGRRSYFGKEATLLDDTLGYDVVILLLLLTVLTSTVAKEQVSVFFHL